MVCFWYHTRQMCNIIGTTDDITSSLSHQTSVYDVTCTTGMTSYPMYYTSHPLYLCHHNVYTDNISTFFCSEFCHTLEWNSHGFTYVPHHDPLSHLPLHPLPLGFPSAPGPSACLMHPTSAGDLFHPRYYTCFDAVLLKHPTLSFSHRV